ncbi:alpha/beta-hydrolase [Stipitochalara longipes BDJ]|nr:alpha/beta-hydrolase [Stipitochalara longipes BDJ]
MDSIEVIQRDVTLPEKDPVYRGLQPSQVRLSKGHLQAAGRAAFQADTIWERDVEIPLRDGSKLRADVFRPATSDSKDGAVPALVAWSPYGKSGQGFLNVGVFPGRMGIPEARTSGLESFEAPDPAEWVARGYAMCNVDARGAYDSEGDLKWWGAAEGRDGYDAVEFLATRLWCNGNVALVGNSWLAISQYFIAAENPPHLKCIAPLEGASDTYRENLCRGGVAQTVFARFIAAGLFGRSQQEDLSAMLTRYPLYNEYWEDKRAKFDRIQVPAYIVASYSTGLHTEGSMRAYEEIKSPRWLRVHPYQEWYDLYKQDTNDELQKFFDRYTKNLDNGWESTPKVRISILGFNSPTILNHVFPDFPIPSTQYQRMYLNTSGQLSVSKPTTVGTLSYQADVAFKQRDNDSSELCFEHIFQKQTYLVGYSRATVYMSTNDSDDMTVFIILRKADKSGRILQHINIPLQDLGMSEAEVPDLNPLKYLGPTGMIRASHRRQDFTFSRPHRAVLSHVDPQKVVSGQVVRLDISIWPGGMAFAEGEKLLVKVSGHEMRFPEFEPLRGLSEAGNVGRHEVYCGEDDYFSEVVLPFVEL